MTDAPGHDDDLVFAPPGEFVTGDPTRDLDEEEAGLQ
jgi:hypothetical protein